MIGTFFATLKAYPLVPLFLAGLVGIILGIAASFALHLSDRFNNLLESFGVGEPFLSFFGIATLLAFIAFKALLSIAYKIEYKNIKENTTCPKCDLPWVWDTGREETIQRYVKFRTETVDNQKKQVAYNCELYWQYYDCHHCGYGNRKQKEREQRG